MNFCGLVAWNNENPSILLEINVLITSSSTCGSLLDIAARRLYFCPIYDLVDCPQNIGIEHNIDIRFNNADRIALICCETFGAIIFGKYLSSFAASHEHVFRFSLTRIVVKRKRNRRFRNSSFFGTIASVVAILPPLLIYGFKKYRKINFNYNSIMARLLSRIY